MGGTRRPTARAQQLRNEATPAERRLWTALSAAQLGVRFNRQMPVGEYVCDFLSRGARLAVELDGESHKSRLAYDQRREAFLRSRGLTVLRFTNADVVRNLEGVVEAIRLALSPPPAPPASGRGDELPSRLREGPGVGKPDAA